VVRQLSQGNIFNILFSRRPIKHNNFNSTSRTFQYSIPVFSESDFEQALTISTLNRSHINPSWVMSSFELMDRVCDSPRRFFVTDSPDNLRIKIQCKPKNEIFTWFVWNVFINFIFISPLLNTPYTSMKKEHYPQTSKEDGGKKEPFPYMGFKPKNKPSSYGKDKQSSNTIHGWNSFKNIGEDGVQHFYWIPFYLHVGLLTRILLAILFYIRRPIFTTLGREK